MDVIKPGSRSISFKQTGSAPAAAVRQIVPEISTEPDAGRSPLLRRNERRIGARAMSDFPRRRCERDAGSRAQIVDEVPGDRGVPPQDPATGASQQRDEAAAGPIVVKNTGIDRGFAAVGRQVPVPYPMARAQGE